MDALMVETKIDGYYYAKIGLSEHLEVYRITFEKNREFVI